MTINMTNMSDVIEGVTLSEIRSMSPDNDAKKSRESKQFTLRVKYDGLTLRDVFAKAFKTDVVSFVNGAGGRKNYDNIVNKQVIDISAKTPGAAPQQDAMETIIASAKAAKMTIEAYVLAEMKKRQA